MDGTSNTSSQAQSVRFVRGHYLLMAVASLVGLADSLYLTVQHLAGENVRCTVVTGCNEVLGSSYAAIAGIPLATLGALAYFLVFSLAILLLFGYAQLRTPVAVVVLSMFAMTLWLLYVQAFVLGKFCSFCLLSAIVTLVLTAVVVSLLVKR